VSTDLRRKETVAIIGLGKVGTAIGHLLFRAGYPIVAVTGRNPSSLKHRVTYTGGAVFTAAGNCEAASRARCIFITTPDDAIAAVCSEISRSGGICRGDKVIHTSGAGGLDLLSSARIAGAKVASIHPLQSFADVEGAIKNLSTSTFGVTAEEEIRDWSVGLVRDIGGIPLEVPEDQKPLYHAAACMASNYLTTLIHVVEQMCVALGLTRKDAMHAFWPLVTGTLENIKTRGTVRSLTGPIARGDIGTLARHLDALGGAMPEYLPLYRTLGLLTVALAAKRDALSSQQLDLMKEYLQGG
jgi:predicted short-subunit dehydrogenase-like oxidoreductase (DUF2520 family)